MSSPMSHGWRQANLFKNIGGRDCFSMQKFMPHVFLDP